LPEEMLAFIFISDELLLHRDSSLIRGVTARGCKHEGPMQAQHSSLQRRKLFYLKNNPGKEASRKSIYAFTLV